jgi:thymidylate synthase (FAD)
VKVDLLNYAGDDLSVVNAARVSFDKWHEGIEPKDHGLIAFLARENHWSPFAHTFLSFRIHAPIFIARQLAKHQVGLAWNEVSRRYVKDAPEFYMPDAWRKAAENVKQGSSEETVEGCLYGYDAAHPDYTPIEWAVDCLYDSAQTLYEELLRAGICPEQARMVLPQSMMTTWIWSGSLYAFARVCKLRLDPHAQRENLPIVTRIAEEAERLFPVSWKELVK